MTHEKKPRFNRFDRFVTLVAGGFTLALLTVAIWPLGSTDAPEMVRFLGRLHPIVVHLPIGFLFALLVLEIFDLFIRSAVLHHATYIMAWLAAGAAVLAVAAGVLLAYPGSYSHELLFWHRWLGVLTAVCAVWILAWKVCRSLHEPHGWSFAYHPLLLAAAALLAGAGHYGGSLTHGSDYLTAYMPAPLLSLLRLPERVPEPPVEIPDDPLDAVVFTTLVQPILRTSCVSCHGVERQRAGLRLDSHEFILEGGESGPDMSLIATSLRLPLEDKRHMPPKERPQLTADEIALLTWWVEAGGGADAQVRDFRTTAQIDRILQARLGIPSGAEALAMREWDEIESAVNDLNRELGVDIRRVARDAAALEIPFLSLGGSFGDSEIARLAPLQANFQTLNLSGSAITDDGLASVSAMKNLVRINLSNTGVGDDGLIHLSSLPRLEYLNLYGTKVTDDGLMHIEGARSLRRVFLWQTGVTSEGVARLQRNLLDEAQVDSWRAEMRELERLIEASRVEVDLGHAADSPGDAGAVSDEPAKAPKAINDECPVSGRPVDPAFTATHGDAVIAFCCGNCLGKFGEDPEPILAKLNLVAEAPKAINDECPVSGRAVDPAFTATHGDAVIAFCCGNCLGKFGEDPEPILAKLNLIADGIEE